MAEDDPEKLGKVCWPRSQPAHECSVERGFHIYPGELEIMFGPIRLAGQSSAGFVNENQYRAVVIVIQGL